MRFSWRAGSLPILPQDGGEMIQVHAECFPLSGVAQGGGWIGRGTPQWMAVGGKRSPSNQVGS